MGIFIILLIYFWIGSKHYEIVLSSTEGKRYAQYEQLSYLIGWPIYLFGSLLEFIGLTVLKTWREQNEESINKTIKGYEDQDQGESKES